MPTTYTHYRFGDRCITALPPELRAAVERYRSLYDIGVHGPDIFFYYHPLKANAVSDYGSRLHNLPARSFFENAKSVFSCFQDKEVMLAYLLGFLSHFTLDSGCHGYVESTRQTLGISHNKLEAVFDSYMMETDGLTPSKVNRGFSLKPSAERAEIIARFFDFGPDIILAASRGQVSVMNLLYSPSGFKKTALCTLIRRFSIPGSVDDLFVDDNIPEKYLAAVSVLDGLLVQALADYGKLAENLINYLNGLAALSDRFDRNFG